LFKKDYPEFAVSRSYYGLYYAVTAILLTKGIVRHRHSGAIAAFGEYFIKTGELPKSMHRTLTDAFAQRRLGDYEYFTHIHPDEARDILDRAHEFCDELYQRLEKNLNNSPSDSQK